MDEIESQLTEMKAALALADDEGDKRDIQGIIDQLEQLLGVYSGTETPQTDNENPAPGISSTDSLAGKDGDGDVEDEDEYKKFQSEIAALSSETEVGSNNQTTSNQDSSKDELTDYKLATSCKLPQDEGNSIENELEDLIGMKCMAPHQENWGQLGYYCAMVSSVLSLEQGEEDDADDISSIMVRVIFLQPVVKSQLLCPFYKEDRCRFSDKDCKFSHGEVVPLSQLREYSEPDYASIIPGARVMAKYHDDLWYKATVQKITDDGQCEVSYDVGNEALTLPLHETSPINDETGSSSDLSSSDEDDVENPNLSSDSLEDIPKTLMGDGLLDMRGGSSLGDWEKYTKGIGSKLMTKMGYVLGTGLGKNREGRVEPVDAIVLPPGKSLDACMALKEKAKDGNLFSAEKRRLRLQRRAAKQQAKLEAQKPKEESTVFEFLNNKLALRKENPASTSGKDNSDIRKESTAHLNKRLFGIDEKLRQVNRDILKTKEAMKRQKGRDKQTYSFMEKKLATLETTRRELDQMQTSVANEKKLRSDKNKLNYF